jgi:histidyl-tRNA synthetase
VLRRGEHEGTGETDLALRYDLTVPLARVIAEHRGALPRVFKRYQIQPVWRADRPAKGRFREFYQCDVDVIGSRSMVVEAELCAAASDVLRTLGFEEFFIRLNHRGLLRGILDHAGVPAALHEQALVAIDKLDKVKPAGVREDLVARGVAADAADRLLEAFSERPEDGMPGAQAFNERVLGRACAHVGERPEGQAAVEDLREITTLCAATSAARDVILDPSLARGLSYYTGAIMEISVADLPGSLGGGGRYDELIGMFLGEQVPACGFSLGLERILVVMDQRNMFPPQVHQSSADVLVTLFDRAAAPEALRLAGELRGAGVRVDVYPDFDKLGKQMKYAAAKGIPFVAILGADERARGEVTVRNMATGDQSAIAREAVAANIRGRLAGP